MDAGYGIGSKVAFQNPYFEVRQSNFLNVREIFFECVPQGVIQRGDRPIALGYGVSFFILDLEFDRCFRIRFITARLAADTHG